LVAFPNKAKAPPSGADSGAFDLVWPDYS
ncbi:MAG: hypothetical protein QOK11_966, partial [Pseudonocardiales bacterium]|nr:hypothetical protein [Pseudonocardiales bacterium]